MFATSAGAAFLLVGMTMHMLTNLHSLRPRRRGRGMEMTWEMDDLLSFLVLLFLI